MGCLGVSCPYQPVRIYRREDAKHPTVCRCYTLPFCAPGRTRTCNQRIKSPMLCHLSYGGVSCCLYLAFCDSFFPHVSHHAVDIIIAFLAAIFSGDVLFHLAPAVRAFDVYHVFSSSHNQKPPTISIEMKRNRTVPLTSSLSCFDMSMPCRNRCLNHLGIHSIGSARYAVVILGRYCKEILGLRRRSLHLVCLPIRKRT